MNSIVSRFTYLLLILILLGGVRSALAQDTAPPLDVPPFPADSLLPDSLAADTIAPSRTESGVDTLVNYSADDIDFDVIRRITILSRNAMITYKDMRLEAGRIEVNWDAQLLTAAPLPDTVWADTLKTEIDTILSMGRPHFMQGQDEFYGDEIAYNMKTKVGRVRGGQTQYEDGYYYGEQFKRIADDVLTAKDGSFTTCDKDTPDYHFYAKVLKVMVGRRVVARPVVLYFDNVPCMAAPYGVFPQQKGRTSGIIIPTFGESSSQGRFLRNIGYYWAISDYMDLRGSIDYFERIGILGRGGWRYTKRYSLDGSADFDFNAQRQGDQKRRDYSLTARHSQILDRNSRLTMTAAYASSKTFVRNTGSEQDQLNQQLRSDATLSKSWDNSPWTANINVGYTKYLNLDTWNTTLPAISLSHRAGQLFPAPKAPRNIRGAVAPKELHPPWYRAFNWSYSTVYRNELSMPKSLRQEGLRLGLINLSGNPGANTTLYGDDSTTVYQKDGMVHSGSISANAKILKYLNINPRISLRSLWTRRAVNYRAVDKILDREDDTGFFQRTTFDIGSSITTKLYGVAQRPLGIGASFRHMMTPTVGFTYRPDFADKKWGYYKTITMPDGRSYTFDRFAGSENISGGGSTPQGISEQFSFRLDHLFQMKTGDPELETEKKYELLKWNMNTAMDMKRDSLLWDNLGMSFSTSIQGMTLGPIQGVGLDVSTTHSFYEYQGRQPVRRFFWERDGGAWYAPLNLLNAAINVGFSINAPTVGYLAGVGWKQKKEELPDSTFDVLADTTGLFFNPAVSPNRRGVPYQPEQLPPPARSAEAGPSELFQMPLSISVNLRQSRDYISHTTTSSMSNRATFTLTPKWKISMDYNFDLDRKEVRNTSVFVTRDLHCWEATFSWSPLGYLPGYFLKIGLKSPQLRDVKIERQRGAGFGSYF